MERREARTMIDVETRRGWRGLRDSVVYVPRYRAATDRQYTRHNTGVGGVKSGAPHGLSTKGGVGSHVGRPAAGRPAVHHNHVVDYSSQY